MGGYAQSFIPAYPSKAGQIAANVGINVGSQVAGNAVNTIPFFGQAVKFFGGAAYDQATTGNPNWKGNALGMIPLVGGFLKNKYSPSQQNYGPMALPGPGFLQNLMGIKPVSLGAPPYSDFLSPTVNANNWWQGLPQFPQSNVTPNYTGPYVPSMDTSAMYASTVPANGAQQFTMLGNLPGAAPTPGYPSTLNTATPYGTAFNPNALGGNFDTGQRFFQENAGGIADGDPLAYGGGGSPATGFFSGGNGNVGGAAGYLYGPFNKGALNLLRGGFGG